ncbi:hypothetical protein PMI16_02045 [Herbaspirillum sp. CF444]|uniref:hypothetical protein n=1 Tax=Herbaspirillum sp. CF444 TaxID=1144319 RepID=UPI0002725D7A|nr:hypothetical protein [Herbaspirillum sp. CF444]EJL88901.1 hypothetical protein PMI16_02045 [Herbaspirillum sp. CF444]
MTSEHKLPYKGHAIFPQVVLRENGQYAACFTIKAGYDGSGEVRYVRELPTTEFAEEDDALAYILDFSADWIDQNMI